MAAHSWDVFCRVIDNFGDAGVCWRLARQLAAEHGARVRLRIDDLASLAMLNPRVQDVGRQSVDGVEISGWDKGTPEAGMPDVVIEAFGCGLPDSYVRAMAGAERPPLWIVLEYLSAESWVREHHRLPSPHPGLALQRYFFFPGFVEGTGGVLREADFHERREGFGEAQRAAFWRSIDQPLPEADATTISMFGYEGAPLAALMRAWEAGARRSVLALTQSAMLPAALAHFGVDGGTAGRIVRRGALEVRVIPFLPQPQYDELLWSCDCNFVRGEDSFVRAQWAVRPFVWQIYPQQDCAHARKLDAFLELYCAGLPEAARSAASNMMQAWNQTAGVAVAPAAAWAAYASHMDALHAHGAAWAARLAKPGTLAENLVYFARDKLK